MGRRLTLKRFTLFRRLGSAFVALGLLCAVVLAVGLWRSSADKKDEKAEGKRRYNARLRDGVGREVESASGDSPAQIRRAVDSVTKFIEKRSGVSVGEATKNRLAALEERVHSGNGRRLTVNAFGSALSAAVLERLASLNDEQIAHVDDTLRGFNAPGMPKNFSRTFQLPLGYASILVPPEKTIGRLKAVRDQLGTPGGEIIAGMITQTVQYNARGAAQNLAEAVPEQFGNLWDVANDRESAAADAGFTPLQAFLVAYSFVSKDPLDYSQANLRKLMEWDQKSRTETLGQPFPSPEGHRAYGVNGYLSSSPLDLFFDEQTVNRFLDRVEKGGGA
jgi:hypothetical protein